MASLVLTVTTPRADISTLVRDGTADREGANEMANYFARAAAGFEVATISAQYSATSPVAANATATCASVSADDTIVIGKTTLTAKASPASEDQFSQAGDDTADAASLAAKINAHSVLSLLVRASSSLGVVTISALQKGVVGNHIVLTSSNNTRLAVTGSGYLASGAGGATNVAVDYNCG